MKYLSQKFLKKVDDKLPKVIFRKELLFKKGIFVIIQNI